MRRITTIIICILFIYRCSPQACAQTYSEVDIPVETEQLFDALPENTQELLRAVDITPERYDPDSVNLIFRKISEAVSEEIKKPLKLSVMLILVIILTRIITEFISKEFDFTVQIISVFGVSCFVFPELLEMIRLTEETVDAISNFLLAAVPVYVGILVFAGNAAVGSTYGTLTLAMANGMIIVCKRFVLPIIRVYMVLSCTAAVSKKEIRHISDSLYKGIKGAVTLTVTLFTGILSIQTLIAAQTDAVSGKAVKMIASGAVPIVGGAFSDAFALIAASAGTVKSGVGAFGLLASIAILVPVSLQFGIWSLMLDAARFSSEVYSLENITAFLYSCSAVVKILLAIIVSSGIVSLVTAAILLCVRGAYG